MSDACDGAAERAALHAGMNGCPPRMPWGKAPPTLLLQLKTTNDIANKYTKLYNDTRASYSSCIKEKNQCNSDKISWRNKFSTANASLSSTAVGLSQCRLSSSTLESQYQLASGALQECKANATALKSALGGCQASETTLSGNLSATAQALATCQANATLLAQGLSGQQLNATAQAVLLAGCENNATKLAQDLG